MKKVLLYFSSFVLFIYLLDIQLHFISDRVVKIKDIHKKEIIHLAKDKDQEHVFSFHVHVYGHLGGQATISLIQDSSKGSLREKESISGEVDLVWRGDWYADRIDIVYEPSNSIMSGEIEISYDFDGIF